MVETTKAVRIHAYGGLEALVYEDVPQPIPGSGQVLIKVQAAGLNPLDWKIRAGYMQQVMNFPLPLILGVDLAGVVAAVGPDVTTFTEGTEVYGFADVPQSGSYAEYALAQSKAIAPKPANLSAIEAASVPVVALTAWQALFELGGLTEGQTVLIHGGAGGLGLFAIQFAKIKGAKVITTASSRNLDFLKEWGADEVLDYQNIAFEQEIKGVDVVLDTIGGDTQERSWSVLKPGGILVSTLFPPSQEIANQRGVRAAMVMVRPDGQQLKDISHLLETGRLKTAIAQVFPLKEAAQAQALSQSGHVRGKIVLSVP